jgi:lipopolysaccharide/colanic/teichoic acid biosynthesis glycosyltransferase
MPSRQRLRAERDIAVPAVPAPSPSLDASVSAPAPTLLEERTWRSAGGAAAKRAMDIALSMVLLLGALPVLIPACAAILLETRGSPFYLQWRSGLMGRRFRIIKLRTMVAGADKIGPALTQDADPRITRVGSFLRRWSIDELPQLANVLAGQMSIVGPRPELISIVDTYTPRQLEVLQVRPGMTGWAQVNGRDDLSIAAKLELEHEYVAERTLLRDLSITARTVAVVLSGRGIRR